ncbi:MAG: hypothetical protein V4549_12070 [Bacteroidota bacterium]
MKKNIKEKTLLIDDEYGKFELENGILIGTWKKSFIDLTTAEKTVNGRLKVAAGQKYPFLVKIKSIRESTKEARVYLASEKACLGILAGAICVDSALENMVATVFLYMSKPVVPTKIFTDETKAKEWLAQFVVNDSKEIPVKKINAFFYGL